MVLLGLPALLLAGCIQIGDAVPADGPERAIAACRAEAESRGYDVQSVTGTRQVTGSGGRAVGQDVSMVLRRVLLNRNASCAYTYNTGRAVIRFD